MQLKSSISGAGEEVVFSGQCTPQGQQPDEAYWSNKRDLSAVVLDWIAGFDKPEDLPHVPSYLRRDSHGIVGVYANLTVINTGIIIHTHSSVTLEEQNNDSRKNMIKTINIMELYMP